ncbi:hypothetical protein KDK77_06145 [bacterium]|nr:hypothetical protein [bacterium]MCP5462346.1 hypothetical protein [bacterium]
MNIDIILVEPAIPENIGFVARSIEVYSITNNLVIINPPENYLTASMITAVGCGQHIIKANIAKTFADIYLEYNTLIGTTRRTGGLRYPLYTPTQIAQFITENLTNERIGLVFGREDNGLCNDELDKCRILSSIPSASATLSLNLSHAVTIYLDALYQANRMLPKNEKENSMQIADEYSINQLVTHAMRLLEKSHFIKYGFKSLERTLQHLIKKPIVEKKDITLLHAICYHLEKFIDKPKQ